MSFCFHLFVLNIFSYPFLLSDTTVVTATTAEVLVVFCGPKPWCSCGGTPLLPLLAAQLLPLLAARLLQLLAAPWQPLSKLVHCWLLLLLAAPLMPILASPLLSLMAELMLPLLAAQSLPLFELVHCCHCWLLHCCHFWLRHHSCYLSWSTVATVGCSTVMLLLLAAQLLPLSYVPSLPPSELVHHCHRWLLHYFHCYCAFKTSMRCILHLKF